MGIIDLEGGVYRLDDAHKLPETYIPRSRIDFYQKGNLRRQRWFDERGNAQRNRDYSHGGKFKFPHDHSWKWEGNHGERGHDHLEPDYYWR